MSKDVESVPFVARLVAGGFPLGFGIIGVTFAGFLWSGSFPLFFRIFGTLIASMFMLVGFSGAYVGFTGGAGLQRAMGGARLQRSTRRSSGGVRAPRPTSPEGQHGYTCPNCDAALKSKADVSPSGDVRCSYCDRWFNIHRAGA